VNEVDVKKAQCIELKGRLHEASKRVAEAEQMASAGGGGGARRIEEGESGEDSEVNCARFHYRLVDLTFWAQVAQLRRELRRAKRSIRDTDDIKRRLQTLEQENADLRTGKLPQVLPCLPCIVLILRSCAYFSLSGSAELDSFDPAFFEEIEDLKCACQPPLSPFNARFCCVMQPLPRSLPNQRRRYQHRETQQQAAHYEEMLRHLSERYG
jgi:hypothetical protein